MVSAWLIGGVHEEAQAAAPLIWPSGFTVHVNVLGILTVPFRSIEVLLPLHISAGAVVMFGAGYTVTVMSFCALTQEPDVEVAVTWYTCVPSVVADEFVRVCAIVEPLDALAPLTKLAAPSVQVNVLGASAVSDILVATPLQVDDVAAVVTVGVWFTVTLPFISVIVQACSVAL